MEPKITTEKEEAVDRATGLLEALLDARVPAGTKAKIQQWFVSDMSKAEKYDALKKLFVELTPNLDHDEYEYEQYRKIARLLGFEEEILMPAAKRRTGLRRYAARAAAVMIPVLMATGAAYLWIGNDGRDAERRPLANVSVSVAEEGQKRIVLPDGSQVWVHSSSNISYNDDFSEKRLVALDGEAFFSVAADPERPFTVVTDKLTVKVLGTEFNVRSYRPEPNSEVIVASGSVQVSASKRKAIQLAPNQRLVLDNRSLKASVEMVDGDTVSMWRVRDLHFHDMPMEEGLRRIGIYYGLDVSIPGWKPTDDLINLDFDREPPLEHVLEAVRSITGNFTYRITDKEVIIEQTL